MLNAVVCCLGILGVGKHFLVLIEADQESTFMDHCFYVCQNAEITGDARIEALARRHMNELLQGVNQIMSDHHAGHNDFLGSIVSSHRPIDRRRKCKRKRSSSEPKRRSKQSKAEARSATSFSVDSVIS